MSNAQAFSRIKLDPRYDFNGIVKLSNCSGAIVKFIGMPDNARAIVMTNGHCVGDSMIRPDEIVYQEAGIRNMDVYSSTGKLVPIKTTKLLYATLMNTDVAFYELSTTYDALATKGVHAFELSDQKPSVGTSIDIVSGYWDRGYRCYIDDFIFSLKEDEWTFKDSIRYSAVGCNTISGTSGSPIIQTGTRTIIAINNTGNNDGKKCTMNNPCEVDEAGVVTVKKNASYGQQTYNVYTCLTPDFRIDIKKEGCELFSK